MYPELESGFEESDPVLQVEASETDGVSPARFAVPAGERARLPLTIAREEELLAKAKNGNSGAREELVESFLPMIRSIAKTKMPFNSSYREDLVQDGIVALLESVERFEPRGIPFEHYARLRVRGAILEGMRTLLCSIGLPRAVLRLVGKYERTRAAFCTRHGYTPSSREIEEELRLSKRQVFLVRRGLQILSVGSLYDRLTTKYSETSKTELWQTIIDENAATPEEICLARSFPLQVERSLRRIHPWERDIIMMRVDDGYHAALTYGEIAMITCQTYREVRTAALLGMRKLVRMHVGGIAGHA